MESHKETLPIPEDLVDNLIPEDEQSECTVWIDDNSEVKEIDIPMEFTNGLIAEEIAKNVGSVHKSLVEKSFEGSTQSQEELSDDGRRVFDGANFDIVNPPYDPECFANFLEVDPVHKSAVESKVRDSVGRQYKIVPRYPIKTEDKTNKAQEHGFFVTEEEFREDCKKIQDFLKGVAACGEDFEEIATKVGMDREAIGWSGFEVIRNASGKIARLMHIPARRLRVLKGNTGFAERVEFNSFGHEIYKYYQPFGQKVGVDIDDPFSLPSVNGEPAKAFSPYDPDRDGSLEVGGDIRWNFISRKTGKPIETTPQNFKDEAANEILYLPNTHNLSVYYGYSDIVPAIGSLLANVYIRDYLLQFFEHSCVPRFAVVVKGAKIDDKFKKYISDYFETKVKGSNHKTMILSLSGMANKNIDIEFRKLDADRKEGDFQQTKKSNYQDIMISHRVSSALLAINESASLGSGKGLSQGEMYKDRVVVPLQLYWARKLNKLFRLGLGCTSAQIEFNELDVRDRLATAQTFQILLTAGVLTINEARRQLGMSAIEGGDVSFVRIREGSVVRVEDLPEIESALQNQGTTGLVEDLNIGGASNVSEKSFDLSIDSDIESPIMESSAKDGQIVDLENQIHDLQEMLRSRLNSDQ